jgi:hypothetical protein
LAKVCKIADWFEKQKQVSVYSSSLLFVYDGASSSTDINLKIIDFAHVFHEKALDERYLVGIRNLKTILEQFAEEAKKHKM